MALRVSKNFYKILGNTIDKRLGVWYSLTMFKTFSLLDHRFTLPRQRCRCEDCGRRLKKFCYDRSKCFIFHHVIPLKDGGKNEPSNLAIVCNPCHYKRHKQLRMEA